MKGLRRGLSVLVSGFLLIGLITGIAWSENIYVAPTGSGDGSVGSPTNLQDALSSAESATENVNIFLQEGTYTSASTFTYAVTGTNTNAIILSGGWNPVFTAQSANNTLTVLDGQNALRVLNVTGDGTGVNFTFTIENLTIQNGLTTTYVAPPGDPGYGAGLFACNYNSSQIKLVIENCVFQNNQATSTYSAVGGAIFITCDYEIYDSTFYNNQAYHYGGAIYSYCNPPYTNSLAPVIDGCTFDSNQALHAGGAHIISNESPVIKNSKFLGLGGTTSSGGSGIVAATNSFFTIENCIFSGNVTNWWSGAIQFWNASGNITNTLFANNKAGDTGDGAGGAMDLLWNNGGTEHVVNITNCTFTGNSTLGYQGYGAAITHRGATVNIVNSIFWNNDGGAGIYDESGSLSITYSDIEGTWTGTSNINSDPKFVGGEDYQLQQGSPCIDKGNNVSGLPATDLAGNARTYNGVVDMGAYEFQPLTGFELISPVDNYECTACSSYNNWWPIFQWDTNATFKSVVLLFYLESNPKKFVKLTASAKAIPLKQLSITSASWNKILLLPGTGGGMVYWQITGTMGDKAKTVVHSPVRSMHIYPAFPVGDIAISPTAITGPTLPTLSWWNNCAVKFKVWFGNGQDFSSKTTKKTSLSFTVKSPNDNGGVFTKQLTSGQWTTIKKLVGSSTTNPIYWYVESWDGLKRYSKTSTEQFTLSP